jgi:hypothetical protein
MSVDQSKYTYYGSEPQTYIAEVISVDDPLQSGRVQIRLMGAQADTINIPDENLNWAGSKHSVSDPNMSGVSGPATGLLKGSHVFVEMINGVPIVTGSMRKSVNKDEDADSAKGGNDLNPLGRDQTNKGGDYRLVKGPEDGKPPVFDDKSIIEYASIDAPRPASYNNERSSKEGLNIDSFSIGGISFT